jgi:adenylylsulfate kinase-like enzyme
MIVWLTGQAKSGKTTLAKKMKQWHGTNVVILDGDEMRSIWPDVSLTKDGRYKQGLRVAKLAKCLSDQGVTVIVAVIAPYKDLRQKIRSMTGCIFYYLTHDEFPDNEDYPYEPAYEEADVVVSRRGE